MTQPPKDAPEELEGAAKADTDEHPRRRFHRLRRALAIIAIILLVVVAIVVLTLTLLLTSSGALAWALNLGLAGYNGGIPGEIAIAAVDGRLADHLVLRGITLSDRDGRAAVTIDTLTLEWRPAALLQRTVAVDLLAVEGLRIDLRGDLGDLSDPEAPPSPPRETLLPELPVAIEIAAVAAREVAVIGADGLHLVDDVDLDLAGIAWAGSTLALRIPGASGALSPGITLEHLDAELDLDEPDLALRATIVTDVGRVELLGAHLNLDEPSGELTVIARARRAILTQRLIPPGLRGWLHGLEDDPELELSATLGGDGVADASLRCTLPGLASAVLIADGQVLERPELELAGRFEITAAALPSAALAPQGRVIPLLQARASGPSWAELAGELRLACRGCEAVGGLDLGVSARRRADRGLAVDAWLSSLGVALAASVGVPPAPEPDPPSDPKPPLDHLTWRLAIADLEASAGALEPLAAVPPLAGALRSAGRCDRPEFTCAGDLTLTGFRGPGISLDHLTLGLTGEPLAARPTAEVTLAARGLGVAAASLHLAGIDATARFGPTPGAASGDTVAASLEAWAKTPGRGDHAALTAAVDLGDPLQLRLDRLDLSLRGLNAHLRQPTRATASADGREVAIHGLDLDLAGGRIQADGALDRDASGDLELTIAGVHLDRLARPIPSLRGRVGGRLSAGVTLKGPAAAPTITASVDAKTLRLDGRDLGALHLTSAADGGRLTANLRHRGAPVEYLGVDADLPLQIDLERGEVTALDGPLRAAVDLRELDLAALGPWLGLEGPTETLDGAVNLEVRLQGTAARPRLTVNLEGRDLEALGQSIGDLDLDLRKPAGADATLAASLRRRGGAIELEARLPVDLSLTGPPPRWRPWGEHRLRITTRDLDLQRQLAGLELGVEVTGTVELSVALDGPIDRLTGGLRLTGRDLAIDAHPVGDLDLESTLENRQLITALGLRAPFVNDLRLYADLPLTLAPSRGEVGWRATGDHRLTLRVAGLDLAKIEEIEEIEKFEKFAPGAGLGGRVDLTIEASAAAGEPDLEVSLRGRDLAAHGRPLGDHDLDLAYHRRLLTADAAGTFRPGSTHELHARVPLWIDLRRQKVTWIAGSDAFVGLHLLGIDHHLLSLAVPLPPEVVATFGLSLKAEGRPGSYRGDLALRGSIAHREIAAMPVHFDLGIRDHRQTATLDLGPVPEIGDLHLEVETRGDLDALIQGDADPLEIPLRATLAIPGLELPLLGPLLPAELYGIAGRLLADIKVDGKIGAPVIRGDLALRDGAVTIVPLIQRLHPIDLEIVAAGRTVEIKRLSARSGAGTLSTTARLDLTDDGYKATGTLTLAGFPLVRPGLPQMRIDSVLKAEATSDRRADAYKLAIAGTRINVVGTTPPAAAAIPTSDAVHLRGVDGASAGEREDDGEHPDTPPPPPKRQEFRVELTDPLEIVGSKVAMRWQGTIIATTTGGTPDVQGQINARDGFLEFVGNRFKITTGSITLPEDEGAIAPFIDLVAETEINGTQISVIIRGRLPTPELILSSRPPLDDSAILTLLLTGPGDRRGSDDADTLANAASLLAAFQSSALRNYVNERTGIDQFAITFDDEISQPVVSLGKRLSDKLYVETAMRINPRPGRNRVEARIEYGLSRRWTLESFFGDAAVGGVDVFWRKIFGGPQTTTVEKAEDQQDQREDDDKSKRRRRREEKRKEKKQEKN